jgi:hypothetical protein
MSLQGPLIVVGEQPAPGIVEALGAAGAFPIVEANWADAPTAFVSVKPAGVVIPEPGEPPSESAARMLCLQIATAPGPIVPIIAVVDQEHDAAVPTALPIDGSLTIERLVARLQSAMRVRALHETALRRIEVFQNGAAPQLPANDPLEDATVLIAGRGPLYPALSVAIGERVKMIGALGIESAAKHLNARDIDGIVIGDGFSPRMVEAFLTVLSQDTRFRDLPVSVIGEASREFAEALPNIDYVAGDPSRLVARLMPMVRMHAFEQRLKRLIVALDTDGMLAPDTGLFTVDAFWRDLNQAIADAADRSQPLSVARFSFDGPVDPRASLDGARMLPKLMREIDFAAREDDGALLIALPQSDLRHSHVAVRRIAASLKNAMLVAQDPHEKVTANVTLATLKAGDTLDSLMLRVMGSRMVAAE